MALASRGALPNLWPLGGEEERGAQPLAA